jgi:hypothetical protein
VSTGTGTYAVGLVYADGNPFDTSTGLTASEAIKEFNALSQTYARRCPPVVLLYDQNDPERGYLDVDVLAEEVEAEHDWSGYVQEDSHDFTPADWDCGLGEVDCGGR